MSAQSYLNLSCDSYTQNIFSGLTRLQEQQEFVDLTLAADGYIVKVHKNIMAIASPYIKEILKSASSDNPVIFLYNVKHNVLNYLLEYIYQGEVNIPQAYIKPFLELSQSLHITGIAKPDIRKDPAEQVNFNSEVTQQEDQISRLDGVHLDNGTYGKANVAACITINNDHNIEVQQFQNEETNIEDVPTLNVDDATNIITVPTIPTAENLRDVENHGNMGMDVILSSDEQNTLVEKEQPRILPNVEILTDIQLNEAQAGIIDLNMPQAFDQEAKDALKMLSQYSLTERGSLQIIVNRYIYCSHHNSRQGRKHRWRCVDYRRRRCPAFIDSFDGRITARKGTHNHGYHDDIIYKKHNKGIIFHSYDQAKKYWLSPPNKHD